MGKDIDFKLVVEGETRDAAAAVDKTVKDLSRLKEAVKRMSSERQKIAQMERRDRYNTLSDEQKLTRLRERQLQLERQLARARSSGNEYRQSALSTSLAKARFEIGRLSAQQKKSGSKGASGLDTISTIAGGGLMGMIPGGAVVGAIGASLAGMGYALKRGFQGSMEFADEISDMAELLGSSRMDVVRMMKSAGDVGARGQTVMNSLSSMAAARGGALSGDQAMLDLFRRYGVGKSMLEGDASNLSIAQLIVRSLGSSGMLPTDRVPLGSLFGRKPEHTVATLQAMERSGSNPNELLDQSLRKMDEVNQKFDDIIFKLKTATVIFSAVVAKGVEFSLPFLKRAMLARPMGALAYFGGNALYNKIFPEETEKSPSWAAKRRLDDMQRTAPTDAIKSNPSSTTIPSMAVPNGDALARIGLYRGGIDPARADILRSQLETLRGIRQEQIRTVAAILGAWS